MITCELHAHPESNVSLKSNEFKRWLRDDRGRVSGNPCLANLEYLDELSSDAAHKWVELESRIAVCY